MAKIKVNDGDINRLDIAAPPVSDVKENTGRKKNRVASVDVFRGLTVAVDDAGGEWPVIGHAPWNACNLADFVMPFFLFIVGIAIALSLKALGTTLSRVRLSFSVKSTKFLQNLHSIMDRYRGGDRYGNGPNDSQPYIHPRG